MNLIKEIIGRRKRLNLTQLDVAKFLNIHRITYSRLERGEIKMTIETFEKLSRYFTFLEKENNIKSDK